MARHISSGEIPRSRLSCLTEMSVAALAAGALAFSGLLWLLIWAVL
ncbi:hypothetical protein [Roseibium sp. MMSF_3412]|nr:hypothetical protein [Roseibium sp. MMSF_3412]